MNIKMKVAVIMTLYVKDVLSYFQECLESIVKQNDSDIKIHIYLYVDGPITEQQKYFLASHKSKFYKIIYGNENKGLPFGLNTLIDNLEDEKYVFRMDADDICLPERFKKQIAFMEISPEVMLCGCNSIEIDSEGNYLNHREYPATNEKIISSLPKCMPILHPSFCIRDTLFKKHKLRYSIVHLAEDLDFGFKVASNGHKMANVQEYLMNWRISKSFIERRNSNRMIPEFKVYVKGIFSLKGYFTIDYIYPCARILFRLCPNFIVKFIYQSSLRKWFLKK